ncbi:MAG: ThuA domain-containing protein [Spirosomataceae bacterium]
MKTQLFRYLYLLVLGLWAMGSHSLAQTAENPLKGQRILVFSKTRGYRHSSIPFGIAAIKLMGRKYGFEVDTTENAERFTEANLKKYKVVVFLSTTGDVLNDRQQADFERYIQAGGGYVGVHAATDTEYNWPWYGKMVGGYFASHPGNPNVQTGTMTVTNKNFPATDSLPNTFQKKDEFYDFKEFNPDVKVLITVDEKSYKDGKMGDYHPMAWYHEYDGGRVFYTNFGHTDETFMEPLFLQHFWGGLRWSASGKGLDYSKARSQRAPEDNRFSRETLHERLDEPTELAVFDNGKVIYVERKGRVQVYDPKKKKSKVVGQIPVYTLQEYGLMGVNIDPNFAKNHWIYLYYSPPASSAPDTAQHLSRFVYDDVKDTLDMASEKVLLRVPVKRNNECCHTGGSIAWDKAGNLYLSTGDDTNPFASDGYGPMDNRPKRAGWDARASSSNTNDLRGKILRIKPQDDGTYTIPEGNLFPVGTPNARPEIYVMGCRNPYRIAVDQRTGFLYWGEVGPDAGENSEKYGPRGHDEVNQARKAGYFGWPLFVADNRAYNQRDFNGNITGPKFDPKAPINDSPHNTGLRELPPAQKAFIYYPYADSPEFGPVVGKGGRNAMAGPVYYSDDYDQNSTSKFPNYYHGKFFAYDWIRDYINIVTLKPNGDLAGIERFLPDWKFSHPMDMAFAKDGSLYMLEYGPNWFAQNDEARLTRITFNAGNRPPVAEASADKVAGASPLKVKFDASKSIDYDGDAIKYEWSFGKGLPKSAVANPTFTYTKPGVYTPVLKVTDAKSNVTTKTLEIKVGNEPPKVELAVKGNKSFYWSDQPVDYEVKVTDKEDGSLSTNKIASEDVNVSINFLQGYDKTLIAQGHQMNNSFAVGKRLIELSDCKACHSVDQKSIGPAYKEVAKKYRRERYAEATLIEKIIKGGGGVWGEQAMSAHPQLARDDVKEMVKYILSLANDKKESQPTKGSYVTKAQPKDGTYIFSASYTDRGNGSVPPQSSYSTVTLRNAKLAAINYDDQKETTTVKVAQLGNKDVLIATTSGSYAVYKAIDLSGISSLSVAAYSMKGTTVGGKIEIRVGSPTGTLLGEMTVGESQMAPSKIKLSNSTGLQDLYLVFSNPDAGTKPLFAVDTITFERDGATSVPSGGK